MRVDQITTAITALAAILSVSFPARATTYTWTGSDGSSNSWYSAGNWGGTTVPCDEPPSDYVFAASGWNAAQTTIAIDGRTGPDVQTLTFNANAGVPLTIQIGSGNSLYLNPSSSGATTIAVAQTGVKHTIAGSSGASIQLIDNQQWSVDGDLEISAVIWDDGESPTPGFVKTGAGTLTLSGANSFSGPITINQGVISVSTIADKGQVCNLGQASFSARRPYAKRRHSEVYRDGAERFDQPRIRAWCGRRDHRRAKRRHVAYLHRRSDRQPGRTDENRQRRTGPQPAPATTPAPRPCSAGTLQFNGAVLDDERAHQRHQCRGEHHRRFGLGLYHRRHRSGQHGPIAAHNRLQWRRQRLSDRPDPRHERDHVDRPRLGRFSHDLDGQGHPYVYQPGRGYAGALRRCHPGRHRRRLRSDQILGNYTQSGKTWAEGDFTYDGIVDGYDLSKILGNYTKTGPVIVNVAGLRLGCGGARRCRAAGVTPMTDVPEPSSIIMLLAASVGGFWAICRGCHGVF